MKNIKLILALVPTLWASAQSQDFVEYANCAPEDYIVIEESEIHINTRGFSYDPPCIKVKPGTTVHISASTHHPLQAAEDFNGIENPFRADSEHATPQSRTLETVGFYGYFCTHHGNPTNGNGMGGAIWVSEE